MWQCHVTRMGGDNDNTERQWTFHLDSSPMPRRDTTPNNRKSPQLQKLEATLQTPAQTECGCLSQTRSNMVMDPVNCMTEYWTMTGKEKPSVNWMGPGWADPRCMGFKALQQTHDT
ncbi:uncharacterized protein LACBIDRAFT_323733 [Laccaria bicolor S238N-H82]|uniref:Predicted protein n=1 Tax=Laccaria bicolor (strain S238N-H82 / ATCC MYA-4686) TaxID=486041 RepID=B0CYL5_LACBS|nr:uncharacterized protein LACBIDRAFT_323732 [Laccaria bicolor S238N-H82]XP_001877171.1 uncharacterized protein LACBIDRAFT_323733 [Laccaria bicolor S238N-H82]EDR12906.1 predicted protein [Laccaria bicolor S238N-H82]EDR12907.1 predicted protein [Laccaria bicolor S238N-H82]|eukprot:XP_001877170.1 predicted protein [Laccaria bicolor S238N-H82]